MGRGWGQGFVRWGNWKGGVGQGNGQQPPKCAVHCGKGIGGIRDLCWAPQGLEKTIGMSPPEGRGGSPSHDVFSWTTAILQTVKSGQGRQGLRIYEQIRMARVKPSSSTFVAALKACRDLEDLESARKIHAELLESGFGSIVNLSNVLVDVYAKCGSLGDARHLFEKMPHRDVVSWNTMIGGYAQMEEGEEALQLFDRMQQEGVVPDNRTFVAALKACSNLVSSQEKKTCDWTVIKRRCLEQIRVIHSKVTNCGTESALFVDSMLVNSYGKCGCLVDARHVFENMHQRNVVSWNAIIIGYAHVNAGEEALQLYARMRQDGVVPDHRTFVAALRACSSLLASDKGNEAGGKHEKSKILAQVRSIHLDIEKTGSESDVYVATMLVDVYGKCGSLVEARVVFEKMSHPNVVSWNAIIFGYAQLREGKEALHLYAQMLRKGILPNDRTFVGALRACSSLAAMEGGSKAEGILLKKQCLGQVRFIHSHAVKVGYESDIFVATMLVDAYAKCGSLVHAEQIFEKMCHRNVVSWNAMIMGYAQMEEGHKALQLYAVMQQDGIVPDHWTYVGALKACGAVVGLEKGKEIHRQICRAGLQAADLFVTTSLIDLYGKCGSMIHAQELFDELPIRSVVTWNALIAGYVQQGQSERVFELFLLMRQGGVQADGVTFLSVLTVCSHVGLVKEGQRYFQCMSSEYGVTPAIEHYTCIVDLLGRAGQLSNAMTLVRAMPFRPDVAVWQIMLGACHKWCNVEVGRQAFECAVRLDRSDASAYTLMSNIYEAAHMQRDAKEIQALRLETLAWKRPGQSWWTDMGGLVHCFLVGDRAHSQSQDIHVKLRDLSVMLKENGHVFPIDQLTPDV